MKNLPDRSIDLFLCDLPYGQLSTKGFQLDPTKQADPSRGGAKVTGCPWDVKIDLKKFWTEVKRLRRDDNTPCIHFCNTRFGYELIKSNEEEFRYDLVWNKGRGISFLLANKQPMKSHEMMYLFSKKAPQYRRVDVTGDFDKWSRNRKGVANVQYGVTLNDSEGGEGKRCALSVINTPSLTKRGGHPTEKPEALYRFLLERYCPENGVVLDPTFGSGNSIFTAHSMGYSAIGIEKDKDFYDKAVARHPEKNTID
jgi:site-specific DNA-methyltransferase (adenine-specific)